MFEYDYVEVEGTTRTFCKALNEMGKEGWKYKRMLNEDYWESGYFCALVEREKEV